MSLIELSIYFESWAGDILVKFEICSIECEILYRDYNLGLVYGVIEGLIYDIYYYPKWRINWGFLNFGFLKGADIYIMGASLWRGLSSELAYEGR